MKQMMTLEDILDFAIASEQEAADFYLELAKNASNRAMEKALMGFVQEEKGHKAKLEKIKENKEFEVSQEKITDLKLAEIIVETPPTPDMTYKEALVIAMKREKTAFLLYSNLASLAENEQVKLLFLSLAQEEAKHKLRFELEYEEVVLPEN